MIKTTEEHPQIKFIRMNTGEDLLSEVKTNSKQSMTLINPLKLVYMYEPENMSLVITMTQWVFSEVCPNQTFIIRECDVTTMSDIPASVVDRYKKSLASNSNGLSDIMPLVKVIADYIEENGLGSGNQTAIDGQNDDAFGRITPPNKKRFN